MIIQLKKRYCDVTAWLQKLFNPRKQNLLAYIPTHYDGFGKWKDILYTIDFDKIPAYVSSVRQKHHEYQEVFVSDHRHSLNAKVEKPALAGSFHIAFIIKFSDGVKWILKIPATGYRGRFSDIEARALESEALTMQLLKRETTIPVPDVYAYSNSFDNEMKCPFILMEYVTGIPLHECWFGSNRKVSPVDLKQHRETALRDIASAMLQMNKFTLPKAGAPIFDQFGALKSVGPVKQYDTHATIAKVVADTDGDENAIYSEAGPFSDSKSWMLNMLNQRATLAAPEPHTVYKQGIEILLRHFVDWLPYVEESDDKAPFVLTHPDFNVQNILVTEEGKLLSFIDWDGVSSVPRCMGNERYPSWLTRDWDASAYDYKSNAGSNHAPVKDEGEGDDKVEDEGSIPENSPEEIKYYRGMYASIIANLKTSPSPNSSFSNDATATALTRHSLIIDNLSIALDNEMTTFIIVERIYNEMVKLQTNGQVTKNEELRYTDESDDDEDDNEEGDEGENNEGGKEKPGKELGKNKDEEHEDEVQVEEDTEEGEFYWPKTLRYVCNKLANGEKDEKMLRGVREGFLMLFKEAF